ncbi:MSMEG_0570 family nitrogen starvation response protein [Shimia marina]|uniref:Family protein n=1 Tax=Shimia marina TaxID=321267 RepID=A0A0P1F8R2_9RHOB|nr:MSMEG_0570 family nitrogen starvation response protein [Shimia marina]CUH50799.1 family protein [Shimia marina]SFE66208.1 MSMEG_0570 family protein [Shimia marina]
MPETRFTVRWPDGHIEECYSPSSVIKDFLTADTTYPLDDFIMRCRIGLEKASFRVEAKFGFRCSSADAQLTKIESKAGAFDSPAQVTCLSIS